MASVSPEHSLGFYVTLMVAERAEAYMVQGFVMFVGFTWTWDSLSQAKQQDIWMDLKDRKQWQHKLSGSTWGAVLFCAVCANHSDSWGNGFLRQTQEISSA